MSIIGSNLRMHVDRDKEKIEDRLPCVIFAIVFLIVFL